MLIATNDSSSVTINIEDLKSIINQEVEKQVQQKMEAAMTGINEKSVLMSSSNSSKEIGTAKLNSFTNNFGEEFSKYFEYDSTNGTLTCKEEGWFITRLQMHNYKNSLPYSESILEFYVNDIRISWQRGTVGTGGDKQYDDNCSIPIYLKKGDKLSFVKKISNSNAETNNCFIYLIKT